MDKSSRNKEGNFLDLDQHARELIAESSILPVGIRYFHDRGSDLKPIISFFEEPGVISDELKTVLFDKTPASIMFERDYQAQEVLIKGEITQIRHYFGTNLIGVTQRNPITYSEENYVVVGEKPIKVGVADFLAYINNFERTSDSFAESTYRKSVIYELKQQFLPEIDEMVSDQAIVEYNKIVDAFSLNLKRKETKHLLEIITRLLIIFFKKYGFSAEVSEEGYFIILSDRFFIPIAEKENSIKYLGISSDLRLFESDFAYDFWPVDYETFEDEPEFFHQISEKEIHLDDLSNY